jgi:hypothetical protein
MEFVKTPKYVGYYRIGGTPALHIPLTVRPRWLTRVLMRWLVEWDWHDEVSEV